MIKRITLIMAITLLLLFSGCMGNDDIEQADASSDTPTAVPTLEGEHAEVMPETEAEEPVLDFSYDESACTPWQSAYLVLLRAIVSRETPERIAEIEGSPDADRSMQLSDCYCLYDVDKDEIPEIFITFGCCEADYRTEVYTFRDGSVVLMGDFGFSHSILYTWPGENAVLRSWGHMGYGGMDKISIVDGALISEEIFAEDISEKDVDYTEPDAIVPGASSLPEFNIMLNYQLTTPLAPLNDEYPPSSPSMFMPLTLPVYDYCPATSTRNITVNGNTKEAVAEVLAGDRGLYGVSGDGYQGDTGWMSFHDYCQPGAVNVYADYPMQIRKSGWVDFNQDGREEYILHMEESLPAEHPAEIYVVLSEQDGIVYAYSSNYMEEYGVFADGVFYKEGHDCGRGISFYKNQCYTYRRSHDIDTPAIVWEIGQ